MNSINHEKTGYEIRTAEKKEKVKNTAVKILQENKKGILNMDTLSEKSGIAKMSIYKYFGSKIDLLNEIALEILEAEHNRLAAILSSDMLFKEKLLQYISIKYEFIKNGYMPLINKTAAISKEAKSKLVGYQNDAMDMVLSMIEQGIAEGEINKEIPRDIILNWMRVLSSAFEYDKTLNKKIEDNPEYFKEFVLFFWRGLRP